MFDKFFGIFLVFGRNGDHRAVHPDVAAFLGDHIGKILIQFDGILGVSGIYDGQGGFAGDHLVFEFVQAICFDHTALFLPDQQVCRSTQLDKY